MSDIIQLLPDHVANQIAAGEVVQRPASVVKELLENALDAGSESIQLIVKEAGKILIQVIDDGKGMSVTDARLSFERHATSKIKSAEDLFAINTKGFRGEALASIAAVSHVEMKTKQTQDEVGTYIKIEGSEITTQDVCVTPKGTSISVKNLFYNIPARRNFLKSDAVEMRHIIDEFQRVALAHPSVAFDLHHNGSSLFSLPSSNYRQRIVNILGTKTNERLVPVEEETDIVKISGFVGKPEFAKRTRGEQFFFVNNRYIKSSYLHHSIVSAFEGLLRDKSHPSYFLYLDVDPKTIDINIHPTKTEIKFEDEHTLYAMLKSVVKHSLGQFSVAPVLDFDRDSDLDTPYSYKEKHVSIPKIDVDRNFNPFQDSQPATASKQSRNFQQKPTQSWESLYVGANTEAIEDNFQTSAIEFESDEVTGNLFENETEEHQANSFQIHRKYIVSTIKSGLLVVDQHRAHTRVLYEELLKNITMSSAVSQQLLFPIELQFNANELSLLNELKDSLVQTGFVFEGSQEHTLVVSGIPTIINESNIQDLLQRLLSDLEQEVPGNQFSQNDTLAKSMAKSMAVKAGTVLNVEAQQHLLNQLFACKEPSVTPQNRKVFVTLTSNDLDNKFI
ncbi:DNA mismatch repair endonuclease MutL [Croceibacter atlanticus]|jgi:DNA mismatch repair protein MutL|uniref:DNA mismatch repair protein MutL n=1 Tax=Croceibacter atlanticus (strain ATCC BAA-628 / JCM 21780 / CIP 108009 / IAM 15332 / KCTC 12090 / HTCC2559) TaxID=216432 RepID=A3U8D6_CROAH|nr:DNA mismatch repair endonuclease MutL [Croceibacter atlanticus]EAP88503.1 putative DNA mismatch repair protein [Croceibacter atlanticus HTCC2559]MAM22303.1 DNA mismatch repair protein MutL [Croceibacter sp.]MBW4969364.1 DNA mismatch repair endonuclease MutL [Croceibacter atlanticus]WSP33478.1 DNA mismatch repair endonuclease MutL [Croceibacter atlanticus]|tara:strand:+ start:559 stop:2412 length:1854 start_codon:yes stop_codon:yes gene_type:complete